LIRLVDRDLADAGIEALSADRRFATAYNAVLQLATIVLRGSGYRTTGVGHHWVTIQSLPHLLGEGEQDRTDYFDSCRRKRNHIDYDAAGGIADSEATELYYESHAFRGIVLDWLQQNRPDIFPEGVTR